jgi:hypothetical protein
LILGAIVALAHPMPFLLHREAMQPEKLLFLSPMEISDIAVRQRFGRHALAAILGAAAAVAAFYVLRPFLKKLRA